MAERGCSPHRGASGLELVANLAGNGVGFRLPVRTPVLRAEAGRRPGSASVDERGRGAAPAGFAPAASWPQPGLIGVVFLAEFYGDERKEPYVVWGTGSFRQNLADFERALRRGQQADRERAERAKQPSVEARAERLRQEAAALKTELERLKRNRQ